MSKTGSSRSICFCCCRGLPSEVGRKRPTCLIALWIRMTGINVLMVVPRSTSRVSVFHIRSLFPDPNKVGTVRLHWCWTTDGYRRYGWLSFVWLFRLDLVRWIDVRDSGWYGDSFQCIRWRCTYRDLSTKSRRREQGKTVARRWNRHALRDLWTGIEYILYKYIHTLLWKRGTIKKLRNKEQTLEEEEEKRRRRI